ncbi:MAG: hypothetical protein H6742_22250 [Alphaproteobacteria bacterium]|nr:hypothetical protein [Alphaproteobacteria bacterium]
MRATLLSTLCLPILLLGCASSSSPGPAPAPAADAPTASKPASGTPAAGTPAKPQAATPPAAAQASADDGPWPTMNVVRPPPAGAAPATLTDVRVAGHEGYHRVAFELSGPVGVSAGWSTEPATRCGSGQPVAVDGDALLVVKLGPAAAHDEAGRVTVPATELRPGGRVPHLVQICDHEGDVSWAIGATQKSGMRVVLLQDPDRVVVDLQD